MVLRRCRGRVEHLICGDVIDGDWLAGGRQAKKRALKQEPTFPLLELPTHILCDVLSRLPLKTIFRCRAVCKMLLELIGEPYFAKEHLAKAPTTGTTLILQESLGRWGSLYFYMMDDYEATLSSCSSAPLISHCYLPGRPRYTLSRLNAEFCLRSKGATLVGSCNGLFCLYNSASRKPYYSVWNPVLCEYVDLPSLMESTPAYSYSNNSAFGFCPSTKEYKVIRFMHLTSVDPFSLIESTTMAADVHTLGLDSWRRIENAPRPKAGAFDSVLNGAVHWISETPRPAELIYSFDLQKEQFRSVPPPSHFSQKYVNRISWINIGMLRECLCMCYIYEGAQFEVWRMGNYGVKESWMKEFTIDMNFYCNVQVQDLHQPIKFLANGDLLFMSSMGILVSFSPKKRTFRELKSLSHWKPEVTAHNLSFISLKDAMGDRRPQVKRLQWETPTFSFRI